MKFKPKFKKFGKLPGQPSKLIRLALTDLEKVEQSDQYEIDMSKWHYGPGLGKNCVVCLAGSVMAGTLKTPMNSVTAPGDFPKEADALRALNRIREGQLWHAFDLLGLGDDYDITDIDVPFEVAYYEEPTAFKKYLNTLADSLESQGF